MKNYLTQGTNYGAADGDHPNGQIQELAGATPGTKGDKVLLGDLWQLIEKCKLIGDITPDGNFDNVTNGYQLLQAFQSGMTGFADAIQDASGGDIAYNPPDYISVVYTKNFVAGTVQPTLPTASDYKGRTITFSHLEGNAGGIDIADFTNLTIPAGHELNGAFVNWIDVHSDGSNWYPVRYRKI